MNEDVEKNFEAVIFDLDGTLIDSMDVWLRIDEEFLSKRGFKTSRDYVDAINAMSFNEAARYTKERFSLDESEEFIMNEWTELAIYEYSNNIKLKDGAKEYIEYLKENGIKIGLATSCLKVLYEPVLKNNGIFDYFDVLCSTGEVATGKETPDIFLHVAKELDSSPDKCLVFEDVYPAICSAKLAGMDVCAMYDSFSEEKWEEIEALADGTIRDFADAPKIDNYL